MSNNVFNLQEPKYRHLEKKYRGCGHGWADVSRNGELLDFCYSDNFEESFHLPTHHPSYASVFVSFYVTSSRY